MMGGRYYKLYEACQELDIEADLAEIRAKRSCENGNWKVKIWFDEENAVPTREQSLQRIKECDVLLIGDTIGTGTTLTGILDWVSEQREKQCECIIYTIAGGDSSLQKIAQMTPKFSSLKVYLANAAFHLAKNGSDLAFSYADYHAVSKYEIEEKLGTFASSMKCAVWDWGDRFTKQEHHLKEIKEYFDSLPIEVPEWLQEGLTNAKVS